MNSPETRGFVQDEVEEDNIGYARERERQERADTKSGAQGQGHRSPTQRTWMSPTAGTERVAVRSGLLLCVFCGWAEGAKDELAVPLVHQQ